MNIDTSRAEAALLTLIVTLIALPAVWAAESFVATDVTARQRLEKLDRDGDGKVSSAEFTRAMTAKEHWWQFNRQSTAPRTGPGGSSDEFVKRDVDRDGFLSEAELAPGSSGNDRHPVRAGERDLQPAPGSTPPAGTPPVRESSP